MRFQQGNLTSLHESLEVGSGRDSQEHKHHYEISMCCVMSHSLYIGYIDFTALYYLHIEVVHMPQPM